MASSTTNPKLHVACSREGVFFLLFTLGLGAAAFYSSKNSLIMLFCFLICMIAATILVGRANVQNLRIARRQDLDIFASRETHISLITRNLSKKPRYALHIFEDFGQDRTIGPVFIPLLESGKSAEAAYECIFHKRGPVLFKKVQVRSRFPLPFFEFRAEYPLEDRFIVYPKRLSSRSVIQFDQDAGQIRYPRGNHFHIMQEVQNGHIQGRILWKLSAKRGKLIEDIQKNAHSDRLNTAIRMIPKNNLSHDLFETQISEITDYCLNAENNGHSVHVIIGNTQLSSSSKKQLLEFLANT